MMTTPIFSWGDEREAAATTTTHPFLARGRYTRLYCETMAAQSGRDRGRFLLINVPRGAAGVVNLQSSGGDIVLGAQMDDDSMAWIRPPSTLFVDPTSPVALPLSRAMDGEKEAPALVCYRNDYDLLPWWWPLGPGGEQARPWQRLAVLGQVLAGQSVL